MFSATQQNQAMFFTEIDLNKIIATSFAHCCFFFLNKKMKLLVRAELDVMCKAKKKSAATVSATFAYPNDK